MKPPGSHSHFASFPRFAWERITGRFGHRAFAAHSKSDELSERRKVIAVFTAAELAVIHDSDPEPVLKTLRYHEVCGYQYEHMMLFEAEMMLKQKTPPYEQDRFLLKKNVLEILSEIKPEDVISTGQTMV